MFKTVLIANRGEIACRIIRTCRQLGVRTVAVYSDADARARHVRLADEAVHIGPAAARESYLVIDRILDAAQRTGAQAIHPGYGFLSENAGFARRVREAGLVLIGPSAETMDLMGSKAAAKAKMATAGVPLIPGYHGDDQSDEVLSREAERVGFPLMLKAAAGGGGKGMRVVRSAGDFRAALAAARREASGAFGDERMILERYLEKPRHIEAQVFADHHGNTVHLFERDCSSQRRHQKIIEEAPAAGLSDHLRGELLAAAVRAAEAVDYRGAGTVEFLVDGEEFFFLEMNTRLQVEHPVTELITGQDLVEWQLRVAAGEPLPLDQDAIRAGGHAMEARIYAEDPDQGFVPSTGLITALMLPERADVRIDTGVEAGDEVSIHYDPMIAKLIVHGADREQARQALIRALSESHIAGPTTNLGFLQQLASSEPFAAGTLDTGQLDRAIDSVIPPIEPSAEDFAVVAAAWRHRSTPQAVSSPWERADGWRIGAPASVSVDLEIAGERAICQVTGAGSAYRVEISGEAFELELAPLEGCQAMVTGSKGSERIQIHGRGEANLDLIRRGRRLQAIHHQPFEALAADQAGEGRLLAPMPGRILAIEASAGDTVREGQTLLIMEAMKMELTIKAPFDGTVDDIAVAVGDLVEADALLLAMAETD